MIEIKVPELGESIQEVQILQWLKSEGEYVGRDEDLVEVETEKAAQVIPAPEGGIIKSISAKDGEFAKVGDVIGSLEKADQPAPVAAAAESASESEAASNGSTIVMPAAQRLLSENNLTVDQVPASGPGGRLLKEDVLAYLDQNGSQPGPPPKSRPRPEPAATAPAAPTVPTVVGDRSEEVKPMSMIRRTIASRLVEAQQTAALLTTFNEVNMEPVMSLRKKYKDAFLDKHGVKLGFMSFFAKAAVEALTRYPAINAEIRGNDIVFRNYRDIGIAIGGGKGLVVPVLRNCEKLSFAEIELAIGAFGAKAKENRLTPAELEGGTFTISNGGVYGSLLSTPIVNPPQSGILGLHSIQDRPIALEGQVVIKPMMYIALTYDHRIVDGREAVMFLRTIKEVMEEPARLFLEV
ncbi:MAG: 2-oxoglutarate dehydrogenase complex dihydrolipoyllysine-residue succinyltransferase [Planctomycetota bacterium]|nr:2-oxoglutarate dehydrogenase complex dihydrolipoyllysine-residue succinyltransferase [Planctomycetota bacterium]